MTGACTDTNYASAIGIRLVDSAHRTRAASTSRAILLLADDGRGRSEFDPAANKRRWACSSVAPAEAGEAFFRLAAGARAELEPRRRAEISSEAAMQWGISHHPGMTDIAAILAAPLPWDNRAARQETAWMLPVGALSWSSLASLVKGLGVESASFVKQDKRAAANTRRRERSH